MSFSGPLFLLASIVCSAAMTLFLKAFKAEGTNRYAIILGNYITCVVVGFLMLKDPAVILQTQGRTLLFGALGGGLFVLSLVMIQRSIEVNGAILTSAFSRLGLIVPLLLSIVFLAEKPKGLQMAGLFVVLAAMWVINGKSGPREKTSPLLLVTVLLAGGFSDSMAKIYESFGADSQSAHYILIVFSTACLITLFLWLVESKKCAKRGTLKDFAAGIAVGVPNYFSASLLLKALASIPAYLAYTIFSTGVLILITAVSMIFFKEKPTRRQIIGLVLILIALVLLNI